MRTFDTRQRLGWIAIALSLAITCFWTFWGIIENFHEGWFYPTLGENLGLMLAQYLSPMLIFMGVTLVSVLWPRVGAGLHILLALLAAWFFDIFNNTVIFFLLLPFVGLGLLYWFGRPTPRKLATGLVIGLPLLTLLVFGIEPMVRIIQRVDDGVRTARTVTGNNLTLTWAPAGPGWPKAGVDWDSARTTCQHLTAAGDRLANTPQNIWRLPSVDEAVRSMAQHGTNAVGSWDPAAEEAHYTLKPDKESPLWDTHSQVIYWWTDTEIDAERVYMISYDGEVWPRTKSLKQGYLGFRCVKEPDL